MTAVHPTACIDPRAELDANVEIGPYAVVEAGVRLAAGVRIGPHAVLRGRTEIGPEVVVHAHAVVGGLPQDRKFSGEHSRVRIGPRTVLREFVTVNGACEEDGVTEIGADAWIMAYCHVAHDCSVGNGVVLANGTQIAGYCSIGEGATLGGVSTVHQGVRIGALAMTGASARVAHDVPPFCLADGHPARLRGLNRVGLRRAGWSRARRQALETAYHRLFVLGPLAAGRAALADDRSSDVQMMLTFLSGSVRGVTSARRRP